MKVKFDKRYVKMGFTAFIVICASLCFYYLVFHSSSVSKGYNSFIKISMPVIDGFIIAYILTPILNLNERCVIKPLFLKKHIPLNEKNKRKMRNFSILMTVVIVLLLIVLFTALVIPQLILSIQSIILEFPVYVDNLQKLIEDALKNDPQMEKNINSWITQYSSQMDSFMNKTIMPQINDAITTFSKSIINFITALWNFIIGFIISIYVMASKERFAAQAKKLTYAVWETERANKIIEGVRFTHLTFIGFLFGKLIDSIIIGLITLACTTIVGTPYAMLISTIVGITNMIPFFGPYFGAIGGAVLIVMVNPMQCLYFLIMIFFIQQFDGNFLGPKILGGSTGLSGFWVIFSITIFGGLYGVPGMIIGVPLFAVIYAGIKNLTNRGLRRRDLPVDTDAYMNVGAINDNHVFVEYNQEAYRKRVGRESNWGKVEDSFRHLHSASAKKMPQADPRYPINLAIPSSYTPDTLDEDKDTKTADDQKNAEEESAYEEYDNKDQQ
jgi:predicted PurR-regulated permease PerM